jgi:tRNA G10  N-methylase Trm11
MLPGIRPIHPFPARMAPELVWDRLHRAPARSTVLDPMAGSGTTPATAQRLGHHAIAFDSDPLAVKIARAWCSRIREFTFLQAACKVLDGARRNMSDATALDTDEETQAFIEFWFDHASRQQLGALSREIHRTRGPDLRDILWCAFSRMIITKECGVSLAMDVSHSRPHRVFKRAPVLPFDLWPKAISVIARNKFGSARAKEMVPAAKIKQADARKLPLCDESVDTVITSPPYLNAIDYLRGHRLSLVWMGYSISELRRLRKDSVGAERGNNLDDKPEFDRAREAIVLISKSQNFARREKRMIAKYVIDLDNAIGEVARVLRPEGRAMYVVGDCNLRGQFVENSKLVRFLMEAHRLHWVSTRRRRLPANKRYLPPPCSRKAGSQLRTRMGDEVILSFRKP